MSSLWTPDGERPIRRPGDRATEGAGAAAEGGRSGAEHGPGQGPGTGPDAGPDAGPDVGVDEEELAAQVEAMRAELANAPVEVVIANHCYGLFELAAVYLSQAPPLLVQARLAIDALASLVDGLEGRLGDAEPQLRDGLSQLRLAYVQIDGARRAAEAGPAQGDGDGGREPGQAGTGAGPEA